MIFKKLYFLILIIFSFLSYSQKEANIWYFGYNAGVDFNSGTPVALTDGALSTNEGVASIADKHGNLLFYTDGIIAYNRLHTFMPNGFALNGGFSSTQSAIIIPKPGSTSIFYIFTVDAEGKPSGLQYSEVDMTLDGGKGDVTAVKNVLLQTPVNEKVTAVLHANKRDIWVISNEFNTNKFSAYLVTSAGVSASPVISLAGTTPHTWGIGYLKASPDGRYLAQAQWIEDNVDVLKFDKSTGSVSSWFNFTYNDVYSVEFSPNSKLLYVAAQASKNVYQYNLTLPSSVDIIASGLTIGSVIDGKKGALQLGPDKKLYLGNFGENYLACIPEPNNLGVFCGFIDKAVNLSGRNCRFGLPNFPQSFFRTPFNYSDLCKEIPTTFLIQDSSLFSSVTWNFGDPTSGLDNSSTFFGPKHNFTSVGTYTIKAIVTSACCANDTLVDVLTIKSKPSVNLGNDTVFCSGKTLSLKVENINSNYVWNTSAITNSISVNSTGKYWIKATNMCGTNSDTIQITEISKPSFALRNDTTICDGVSLDLNIISTTYSITNYLWSNSSTNSSIGISDAGTYWAKASNQCGSVTDTVIIDKHYKPKINLSNDTVMCYETPYLLQVSDAYRNYLWDNGATTFSTIVNDIGTYWVHVSNECGSASDTINIRYCDIVVPNIITTNGDGINDIFSIRGLQLGVADLKILNRWGNSIYESKGYNNDWSPKELVDGVYYYILNYPPDNKTYTGFVTVFNGK